MRRVCVFPCIHELISHFSCRRCTSIRWRRCMLIKILHLNPTFWMLPSISAFCEGSVRLPLLSSGDSGAFVSECVRTSSCAHRRFSERPVCHSAPSSPALSTEDSRLYCRQESTFFSFFFSEIKLCCKRTALFLCSYFSMISPLLLNGLYCTSILAMAF